MKGGRGTSLIGGHRLLAYERRPSHLAAMAANFSHCKDLNSPLPTARLGPGLRVISVPRLKVPAQRSPEDGVAPAVVHHDRGLLNSTTLKASCPVDSYIGEVA
jgi:hypothetical protein